MDSVVVHVTGRAYPIGGVLPGDVQRVRVRPVGESHVEIEPAGQAGPRLVVETYLEPGYQGELRVRITGDSVVAVRDHIRPPY